MGKVLLAVVAALALCIGGLGLVIYLHRPEERLAVDNLLAEDLTRRISTAEDRGEDVDLAAVTGFAWDRVLIAAPDATTDEISTVLGFEFTGHLNYSAESNGVFVFVRRRHVARYADYRGRGRFTGFATPVDVLPARDAVLEVRDLVISPK